jgi:hypothetical protein
MLQPDIGLFQSDMGMLRSDIGLVNPDIGLLQPDIGLSRADIGLLQSDVGLFCSDIGMPQSHTGMLQSDMGKGRSGMGAKMDDKLLLRVLTVSDRRLASTTIIWSSRNAGRLRRVSRFIRATGSTLHLSGVRSWMFGFKKTNVQRSTLNVEL